MALDSDPQHTSAAMPTIDDVEKASGETDTDLSNFHSSAREPAAKHDPALNSKRPPLEQVHSKHSVNNVSSIPNGGLTAWLQVVGSFFLMFNTW